MNHEQASKAVIDALAKQMAKGEPYAETVARALAGHEEEIARALAQGGTANMAFGAIFFALSKQLNECKELITRSFLDYREQLEASQMQANLLTAKVRQASVNPIFTGDFDRSIPTYSEYPDEQEAYARMCQAVFDIGDLLKAHPRGSYVTSGCAYWLADCDGTLTIYCDPDPDPSMQSCNIWLGTHVEGLDSESIDSITADLKSCLANPQIKTEAEPGLLEALVMTLLQQVDEYKNQH